MIQTISKSDWIFGVGPSVIKLMIIGEAPGKQEEIQKRPFVGPSGELLTDMLEVANLKRSEIYITNVVKIRPPENHLELLHLIENPETGVGYKIEDFLPLLWQEIEIMKPNCILAVGTLAMEVLTGKKGIKSWRGSILSYINSPIKVIPTIHPAALFERNRDKSSGEGMFSWKQKCHIQFDIIKAAEECKTAEFDLPVRTLEVIKSSLQLERFFELYKEYDKVYVDTEVFKAHLVCIGFAFTRFHGCSVSLINVQNYENHIGIPLHDLVEIWKIVAEKLADPNLKIAGQNFKADKVYWLEKAGFIVNGFCDDGMFKFHTLSPELPKSLAFQQSILTREPFHKNEGKEYNPHKDKLDDLLKYNAKDCVMNCECEEEMDKDIDEFGLRDFFENFVMPCYPIYETMEKRGWKVDLQKRDEIYAYFTEKLKLENAKRAALLSTFNLEDVNFNSPKQVGSLIFGSLRCPERKNTQDETLTALANNAVKNKVKKEIIYSILHSRSIHKLKETYVNAKVDPDGRIRYSYNQVGTETGRTSTSTIKKPLRNGEWGIAIQTTPRPDEFGGRIREMYIPDPGQILIEFDQSQAEARIVALLANDLDLLALFDILDVHKLTASFLFNMSGIYTGKELIKAAINQYRGIPTTEKIDFGFLDLVEEFQRQVGKSARHGFGYNLGEDGLSKKMKISLYRAKMAYQKLSEMSPQIKEVFHEDIQAALANNNRVLWTPFGRRREFFNKWGNELFREAYAHIPQSTIGDNTKRCLLGIKNIDWIELLAEMHDGFVAQIPLGREKDCYEIVKPIFEQSIDFEQGSLKREPIVIPVDAKLGMSWGTLKKYNGDKTWLEMQEK